MSKQFLLKDVSGNDVSGDPVFGDGSERSLIVWATSFGGGSVVIEISEDGVTFVPVTENGGTDVVFTLNTSRIILKIPSDQYIRARLAGATGATGVNVVLF